MMTHRITSNGATMPVVAEVELGRIDRFELLR